MKLSVSTTSDITRVRLIIQSEGVSARDIELFPNPNVDQEVLSTLLAYAQSSDTSFLVDEMSPLNVVEERKHLAETAETQERVIDQLRTEADEFKLYIQGIQSELAEARAVNEDWAVKYQKLKDGANDELITKPDNVETGSGGESGESFPGLDEPSTQSEGQSPDYPTKTDENFSGYPYKVEKTEEEDGSDTADPFAGGRIESTEDQPVVVKAPPDWKELANIDELEKVSNEPEVLEETVPNQSEKKKKDKRR